eukprot:scaffold250811_cov59-Attheya_sp.AAC.2
MPRFRKGKQVLCCVDRGRSQWVMGTISQVGYTLSEDDVDVDVDVVHDILPGLHRDEFAAGDVVPYQVRVQGTARQNGSSYIFVPEDHDDYCCELSSDNIVRLDMERNVLESQLSSIIRRDKEEAHRLLKLAVQHRHPTVAMWIVKKTNLPTRLIGKELLKLAVNGHAESRVYDIQSEEEEELLMAKISLIMLWLKEECDASIEYFTDKEEHHVEHIAAINGDYILLRWLLKKELTYARSPKLRDQARIGVSSTTERRYRGLPLDASGNTPLHYMASAGYDKLIHCYYEDDIHQSNYRFENVKDFNAVNSKGKTALDLAKGDTSTTESLRVLEKQIYQGVLNEAIRNERSVKEIDYTELQRLIQEYNLDVELAMSGEFHTMIDSRFAVFHAIEQGNISKLQWFIETMKLADISLRNDEGLTLLHIAARTDTGTRREMTRRIEGVNDETSFWFKHKTEYLENKSLFLVYDWDGKADLISEMEGSSIGTSWHMNIEQYKKHCEGTKETAGRLKIIQWLIRKGLMLPEIDYILNECEFPTAQLLLEY